MQEGEEICEALPRKEVADIVEGEGTHLRRTVSRVLGFGGGMSHVWGLGKVAGTVEGEGTHLQSAV